MAGVLRIEVMTPTRAGAELAATRPVSSNVRAGFMWLVNLLSFALGGFGARLRVAIEESSPVAATGTVTLTQASLTAGDFVGIGSYKLTAVAGAAVAASGQFSIDTSDTAAATSLAAAINAYPPIAALVSATSAVGVVTITARQAGIGGNAIILSEQDAGGGIARSGSVLSGGLDPASLKTVLGTFSGVGTAADTISIGGVILTLVASAANENEITIGGTAAISATNTIAVINAHTKLKGFVLASSGGSAIVSLQLLESGRIGNLVALLDAGTGFSWASASFAPTGTEAWVADPVVYTTGTSP